MPMRFREPHTCLAHNIHGSFGLMLVLGFVSQVLKFREPVLAFLGLDEWPFTSPLMHGDPVHLQVEIISIRIKLWGRWNL